MARRAPLPLWLLLALVLPAAGSGGPAALAAELSIHGSSTVAGSLMLPHKRVIEGWARLDLKIFPTGSGRGVQALLDGRADMAMIAAPLDEVAERLNRDHPGLVDARGLRSFPVGHDAVAVIRHPDNPVRRLTKAQLTGILAGRVRNWSEVGGLDRFILVIAEPSGGGVRTSVEAALLGKAAIAATVVEAAGADAVAVQVAGQEGALGLTAPSLVRGDVARIDLEPPLIQPLILVTRGAPTPAMQAVIAAAQESGGGP